MSNAHYYHVLAAHARDLKKKQGGWELLPPEKLPNLGTWKEEVIPTDAEKLFKPIKEPVQTVVKKPQTDQRQYGYNQRLADTIIKYLSYHGPTSLTILANLFDKDQNWSRTTDKMKADGLVVWTSEGKISIPNKEEALPLTLEEWLNVAKEMLNESRRQGSNKSVRVFTSNYTGTPKYTLGWRIPDPAGRAEYEDVYKISWEVAKYLIENGIPELYDHIRKRIEAEKKK